MTTIVNPFKILANGEELPLEILPNAHWSELVKPEYRKIGYGWFSNGNKVFLSRSAEDISSIAISPKSNSLILVTQAEKDAPDNAFVIDSDGNEITRLRNPYLDSDLFKAGDYCEFEDVRVIDNQVALIIYVRRDRPNSFPQEPHYGVFFDCDTWQPKSSLKFIDSKNL